MFAANTAMLFPIVQKLKMFPSCAGCFGSDRIMSVSLKEIQFAALGSKINERVLKEAEDGVQPVEATKVLIGLYRNTLEGGCV